MAATLTAPENVADPLHPVEQGRRRKRHYGTHLILLALSVMWLIPLLWTLYTALRPKAETDKYGYFSIAGAFNLDNFRNAWEQAGLRSTSSTR